MGQELEAYRSLCKTKSGAIAVDQHLVYLVREKHNRNPDNPATKSHAQIQVAKIREVEAKPGDQAGSFPKVCISYLDKNKEQTKEVVFPKVKQGGSGEYKKFVNFLKSKEIMVKEIKPTATQTTEITAARTINWRKVYPVLCVLAIAAGVTFIFFKQYVFAAIGFLWAGAFIYQYYKD